MQIDLTELKRYHWFEDVDGNVYDTLADNLPKDKDYFTYHVVKPCEYHDDLAEYTYHPEHLHSGNSFYQAMLNFNWFYNWMFNRMKKRGDNKTFKHICTFNTTLMMVSLLWQWLIAVIIHLKRLFMFIQILVRGVPMSLLISI